MADACATAMDPEWMGGGLSAGASRSGESDRVPCRTTRGRFVSTSPRRRCAGHHSAGGGWGPSSPRGRVTYRLRVQNEAGESADESPAIPDPAHSPSVALPPGRYRWRVEALDASGRVAAVRAPSGFAISSNAIEPPWIPAATLLARVPREQPRLMFPGAELESVRATLETTRRDAFPSLRQAAQKAIQLTPMSEPDYDRISDPAARRLAYTESFRQARRLDEAMVALALMYLLSSERRYGEAARPVC